MGKAAIQALISKSDVDQADGKFSIEFYGALKQAIVTPGVHSVSYGGYADERTMAILCHVQLKKLELGQDEIDVYCMGYLNR